MLSIVLSIFIGQADSSPKASFRVGQDILLPRTSIVPKGQQFIFQKSARNLRIVDLSKKIDFELSSDSDIISSFFFEGTNKLAIISQAGLIRVVDLHTREEQVLNLAHEVHYVDTSSQAIHKAPHELFDDDSPLRESFMTVATSAGLHFVDLNKLSYFNLEKKKGTDFIQVSPDKKTALVTVVDENTNDIAHQMRRIDIASSQIVQNVTASGKYFVDPTHYLLEIGGKFSLFNWVTGEMKALPKIKTGGDGKLESLRYLPEKDLLAFTERERTLFVVDLQTGKVIQKKLGFPVEKLEFANDGKALIARGGYNDEAPAVLDLEKGTLFETVPSITREAIRYSELSLNDNNLSYTLSESQAHSGFLSVHHYNIQNGDHKIFEAPEGFQIEAVSGKYFALSSKDTVRIVDINTGRSVQYSGSLEFSHNPPEPFFLIHNLEREILIFDCNKGEITKKLKGVRAKYFSDASNEISYIQTEQEALQFTHKTSELKMLPQARGDNYVYGSSRLIAYKDPMDPASGQEINEVTDSFTGNILASLPSNYEVVRFDPATNKIQTIVNLRGIETANLWYSAEAIEAPISSTKASCAAKPESELILHQADLENFKNGNFDERKDLPRLLQILNTEKNPGTLALILGQVLQKSNALYDSILEHYPKMATIDFSNAKLPPSAADLKTLARTAIDHLKMKIHLMGDKSDFDSRPYGPLSLLIREIPEGERTDVINEITEDFIDRLINAHQFPEIQFRSKIYKLMHQKVAAMFGAPHHSISDLTFLRVGHTIQPVIIGTERQSHSKSTRAPFDLWFTELEDFPVRSEDTDKHFEWDQNGRHYSADLSMRPIVKEAVDIAPPSDSPPYESLWASGLHGAMVIGSTLESADWVLSQYRQYYLSQGFVFEEPREVSTMQFLSSSISKGPLDYLIKEAHSDGDDQNLFRIHQKSQMEYGTKTDGGRVVESIALLKPSGDETGLIPNRNFGEWVKDGNKSFVYFNTSCNSYQKAQHEIEAVSDSKFTVIPTASSADTFTCSSSTTLHEILDGFRAKKTYNEIRDSCEGCSDRTRNNRDSNIYLFPDDERFDTLIRKVIEIPVDIQIKIRRDGADYNIDQPE